MGRWRWHLIRHAKHLSPCRSACTTTSVERHDVGSTSFPEFSSEGVCWQAVRGVRGGRIGLCPLPPAEHRPSFRRGGGDLRDSRPRALLAPGAANHEGAPRLRFAAPRDRVLGGGRRRLAAPNGAAGAGAGAVQIRRPGFVSGVASGHCSACAPRLRLPSLAERFWHMSSNEIHCFARWQSWWAWWGSRMHPFRCIASSARLVAAHFSLTPAGHCPIFDATICLFSLAGDRFRRNRTASEDG